MGNISISTYKELYNTLITSNTKSIIIEYSHYKGEFTYKPFSHHANCEALNNLYDLVIDNTVFYAFSENEILKYNEDMGILDDLRAAAKYAFAERLPQRINADSDGTLGEVLLDLIIQVYEPNSEKLIARAKHTEVGKKSEITGYDALYFTKNNDIITLWLGQAKAGSLQYCKSDIKNDLNLKFSKKYFSDTAFYISTRTTSGELSSIVNDINKLCFLAQKNKYSKDKKVEGLFGILKKNNVKIKIPCLLAYTKDIYSNPNLLNDEVTKCIKQMCHYFDSQTYSIGITLPYEIVFYIFPIKDVSHIRNKIATLKKETY